MISAVACALLPMSAPPAGAERFVVQPGDETNEIVFVSRATLETFEGRTRAVRGFVSIDPADVGDSLTVRFEVDLATFDTGIELRNKHMRENHLETDVYPTAVFEGARILGPIPSVLHEGEPVEYVVQGTMQIHGRKRRLRASVELTLLGGERGRRIHIQGGFPIHLDHYDIAHPKFLIMKVDKVQQIEIDLVAREEPGK